MPGPRPRHLSENLKANINALIAAAALRRRRHPSVFYGSKTLRCLSRSGNTDDLLNLAAVSPALTSTVFFFNTLINAFIVCRCRAGAAVSFAHLKRSGIPLANSSYSILLKLQFLLETDSESAYAVIGAMVKSGCRPDPITYSTLISGLCRVGRIEEAWGVLDRMEDENCLPTVRCYTSIVLGYCNEGRIDQAKGLIEKMASFGCPPDEVTYTILIGALCERGYFDEVDRVLGESESNGWKPNEVTYNVYMNGLCKAGEVDEAFRKLYVMRERGLCPTVETLHILFDSLSCDLSDQSLWEVVSFLSWDGDVFFYNTLVARLCQNGSWKTMLKLLAAMLKRGMMDICTFTIMIKSLCKRKMLREAKYVFCSMDFQADVVAINTLLLGFNMAGEFSEVYLLFDLVGKNGIINEFTYSVVIDSLCRERKTREAVNFFLESSSKGFLPSLITRPISWLVKDGKCMEIIYLFDEMLKQGLFIHTDIFNSLIWSFCKKGLCQSRESDTFNLIFDRMLGIR